MRAPRLAIIVAGLVALNGCGPAARNGQPGTPSPVARVELQRYVGTWYEVALIPNWFQRNCVRATTAHYTLRADGRIDVINRCIDDDGDVDEAAGVARVVDRSTNAKLEVSFVAILGMRPFWGDYWIIGLDPDYRWAVIGTPSRRYGWILSRTPRLDDTEMEQARAILREQGYDLADFVMSRPAE